MIHLSFRDMANFEPMLATLDNNKERLKIKSYGISDTTLEEVTFMNFQKHQHQLIQLMLRSFLQFSLFLFHRYSSKLQAM